MKNLLILIIISLIYFPGNSQLSNIEKNKKIGIVIGRVTDKISGQMLEYSNVAIFKTADSSLVSGAVTNENGMFELTQIPFGEFYLSIQFIGYQSKTINNIIVSPEEPLFDLGVIVLAPSSENIKGIVVVADQNPVLYKIDKKIVTVGSNVNSNGGTAVDVLENTPSVKVDIEGNVSVRGSENFTVLVDGRPSPFEGTDALQQIPSGMIDKIEVITNPSVKYDPDGTAGIINVITKEKNLQGASGIVNMNVDSKGSYGGDFNVNMKKGNVNYFLGASYSQRRMEGYRNSEDHYLYNDTTKYIFSEGDRNGGRLSSSVKAGLDFNPSVNNNFLFSVEIGERNFERTSESNYLEYTLPETDSLSNLSDDINERGGKFINLNLDYNHKFNSDGHELKGYAMYKSGDSYSDNSSFMYDKLNNPLEGQKSLEDATENEFQVKLDYSLPFSKTKKFEAGIQTRVDYETEKYTNLVLDIGSNNYVENIDNNTVSDYHRNIYSIYSLYLGEWKAFGYQVGMRGEYTDRVLSNSATDTDYFIDRLDYFPSAHISLQLPFEQQLMASYSRRIERPRNYFLEPFLTYRNAYTVYQGNPDLKPEYIDSYELSYQKSFGKSYYSVEAYMRQNNNKIERIRSVYAEDIMLHTFDNVGKDLSTGTELLLSWMANNWYNMSLSGNVYYYKIVSDLVSVGSENESTNWDMETRHTFRIGKRIRVQADASYNGPSVTAQGRREGFFMAGSSASMEFLDGKLKTSLRVRDIFGTGKHEYESFGEDFYSKMYFERKAPVFSLSVSYKINNYKENKKPGSNGSFDGDMDF